MTNIRLLFLGFAVTTCALGMVSAQPVVCTTQLYKDLVWYDSVVNNITNHDDMTNEAKLAAMCRALHLVIARVAQIGCPLSGIRELQDRQRSLFSAGATACLAARPQNPANQLNVARPRTVAITTPFATGLQPESQAIANNNIYDNLDPCDMRIRNCYLQFQINLLMRFKLRNHTCDIIESFANCLLTLRRCGFFQFLKPLIIKETISNTPFAFWEPKACPREKYIPTTVRTLDTTSAFKDTTIAGLPATTAGISGNTSPNSTYSSTDCGRATFKCLNGKCVSFDTMCNAVDNCGDGSDEIWCQTRERKNAIEMEKIFIKYGCYDVMSTCTSLHVKPLLLKLLTRQQPSSDNLCKASNKVLHCAIYERCPLSDEDKTKLSSLLINSFEQLVSPKTCQLITVSNTASSPNNIDDASTSSITNTVYTTTSASVITTNTLLTDHTADIPSRAITEGVTNSINTTRNADTTNFTNTQDTTNFTNNADTTNFTKTPGTTNFTQTPDTTNFTNTGDTTNFTNTPDTINFTNTPDTTNFTNTPDTTNFTNTPDTTNFTNTPDTTNFTNTPDTTNFTNTPDTTSFTNTPDTTNFTNTPDTINFTNTPDTTNFTNTPDTTNFTNTPDNTNFINTPDTTNFINTPDTTNFTNTPDNTNFINTPDTTNFTNTPDNTNFINTPDTTNFINTPNTTNFTNIPDTTNFTKTTSAVITTEAPNFISTLASNDSTTSPTNIEKQNLGNSSKVTSPCIKSCEGLQSGNYQSCAGCNMFATCSEGVLYDNRPCPAALLWDDVSKRCDVSSSTCQTPGACVSSCDGLQSGEYQSCQGCDVYLTCNNGVMSDNKPCPAGLLWNDLNKRCEQFSSTCTPTTPGGQKATFNCVKSCDRLVSGNYQSCLGCSVYVSCDNGVFTDNRPCPNFMLWDDTVKRCEHVSVTCTSPHSSNVNHI